MSIIILILSLNGNPTTVQIPLKVDVETCEKTSLPKAKNRFANGSLTIVTAKCFSTEG